jgi:hypothetical protein
MDELPRRKGWLPSPGFLVGLGICVLIAALAIPAILSWNRANNERLASTTLRTLTSAEAEFRANDRDHNKIMDFWTGDVSGLYYVKPVDGGPEVRLIDVDVANADANPILPLPLGSGSSKGYRYQAFDRDDSVEGEKGVYRIDTDHSGRKVHHLGMFGFIAFPANRIQGKYRFMINENNTTFRWHGAPFRTTWPSDGELRKLMDEDED